MSRDWARQGHRQGHSQHGPVLGSSQGTHVYAVALTRGSRADGEWQVHPRSPEGRNDARQV